MNKEITEIEKLHQDLEDIDLILFKWQDRWTYDSSLVRAILARVREEIVEEIGEIERTRP